MSNKIISVLGGALLAIGAGAAGVQACSSSSSGNGAGGDNSALCNQACDKFAVCFADAGAFGQTIVTACRQGCGAQCVNQAAIAAKAQECLALSDCDAFLQCAQTGPDCQSSTGGTTMTTSSGAAGSGFATGSTVSGAGTTGAGGTTGSGGSSGTGGTGAGASCDPCTKADACCLALGGSADQCQLSATCDAESGQNRDGLISICTSFLQNEAADPTAPAACK
jgi:hypothetical protein